MPLGPRPRWVFPTLAWLFLAAPLSAYFKCPLGKSGPFCAPTVEDPKEIARRKNLEEAAAKEREKLKCKPGDKRGPCPANALCSKRVDKRLFCVYDADATQAYDILGNAEFDITPYCGDSANPIFEKCRKIIHAKCDGKDDAAALKACIAAVGPKAAKRAKEKPKHAAKPDAPDEADVDDEPEPPADPFPGALATLFPGEGGRVERAVVEYLAKDKAAKDELIAAAGGTNKAEVVAKWRRAAVAKAGEHLANPSADPAFASHLAAKPVTEPELAGYYCPNRPAASGDKTAMKDLKAADAGGAAALGSASVEGVKTGSALSPAEILDAKCGGGGAPAGTGERATEAFALKMSSAPAYGSVLKTGEVPPASGPGGGSGGSSAGDKALWAVTGAIAGAAIGLAFVPVFGPIGILIGALVGALIGFLKG